MTNNMTNNMNSGYQAFIDGQAFVKFNDLSVVRMTGADRLTVLNNLCTNDIKRLETDRGCEAFITDVRGRAIGHFGIFNFEEELLLIGSPGQGQTTAAHIDRYIIREDALVTDCSEEQSGWLFSGRRQPLEMTGIAVAESPSLAGGLLSPAPSPARWLQLPWTSQRDCLVLAEREDASAIDTWMLECGFAEVSGEAYQAARIEAGWPEFGIDCSDANLPQEIDRNDRTISFTKGCYLGQETVARLDALGQVQKKLVRMRISGQAIPPAGTKLVEADKPGGEVRSAVGSPQESQIIALGYVRRKWFDSGSRLQVGDTDQTATVI